MTQQERRYITDGGRSDDGEPLPEIASYHTVADIIDTLGNKKRFRTFYELAQGVPKKEIHEQYEPSRSSVSSYVEDFQNLGLVDGSNGDYELTDWGIEIYETLLGIDEEAERFERQRFRELHEKSSLTLEDQIELLESLQEE